MMPYHMLPLGLCVCVCVCVCVVVVVVMNFVVVNFNLQYYCLSYSFAGTESYGGEQ